MDRIHPEPFRLGCPLFADEFVGRQALERLESAGEVVGINEVAQMLVQLRVVVVVEALDSSFFDRSVHSLDLPIGPWMFNFGQAMFNAMSFANPIEDVLEGISIRTAVGKLDPVVSEHRMQLVRNGLYHIAQELGCSHLVGRGMEFGQCELGRSVDSHEEVELALSSLHFGDVNMEIADGVALEALLDGLVTFYCG